MPVGSQIIAHFADLNDATAVEKLVEAIIIKALGNTIPVDIELAQSCVVAYIIFRKEVRKNVSELVFDLQVAGATLSLKHKPEPFTDAAIYSLESTASGKAYPVLVPARHYPNGPTLGLHTAPACRQSAGLSGYVGEMASWLRRTRLPSLNLAAFVKVQLSATGK